MKTLLRWAIVPALLTGCMLLAAPVAHAAPEILDNADFFKDRDVVHKANERLKEVEKKHHVEMIVETFKTAPVDLKGKTKDEERAYFHKWAETRFKETGTQGVYVLICRSPGHLEAAVGNDTQKHYFTLKDRDEMVSKMLAKLREKQNDEALTVGVNFFAERVDANHKPGTTTHDTSTHAKTNASGGWFGGNLMGYLCIAVVVLLGVWMVVGLIRMFTGGGGGGGYGGGGYGGGGGGFFSSMIGGMFGAAAGMWMYNSFFGGGNAWAGGGDTGGGYGDTSADAGPDDTSSSAAGGDFDGGDAAGSGDYGGGGDFGGGDDFGGGGDFGGGDFGGGDF